MIKGFKDFLMRGNVVDLAVGIAIGVAFTTLVKTFGDNFVNPIVASIGGGGDDSNGFGFKIRSSGATFVNIGAIINAAIIFVITMAVIYFVIVVPVQKLQSLRKPGDPEPEAVPEDIALLREIRDSLKQRP
jgi:large conductance mechanosensitive channel